jgi:threonine efflux protein
MSIYFSSFILIIVSWFIIVILPGPNLFATVSSSTCHSRMAGIATSMGIAFGTTIWCILSLLGLTVILHSGSFVYEILKLLGGAYLIYLGLKTILTQKKIISDKPQPINHSTTITKTFIKGVMIDLSNPKAAIYFTSLFAVGIPIGASLWYKFAVIVSIVTIAGAWYSFVSCFVTKKATPFINRKIKKLTAYLSGIFLIIMGTVLFLKHD